MARTRIIILGAAGRDFHLFNVLFRNNSNYEVVAFTAAQIPFIANRTYPKELSGRLYPNGIKIYDESKLPLLIKRLKADACILAYSDLNNNTVMEKASIVNANGADFWLVAPEKTMLKSNKPVIAVCGVRTGVGKSPTSRYIAKLLKRLGKRVVVIRHPMPYGDLSKQVVERFEKLSDLDKYNTTIEEREDYEPHINNGFVVFAGVDYEKILRQAEKEADIIVWDGGNNDTPFIKPDLMITVADPLRAGNELTYYPGQTAARMAAVLLINKVNSASEKEIQQVKTDLSSINQNAEIIMCNSVVSAEDAEKIKGKRVLLIEDGPTITHGGASFGAATVAAKAYKALEIVDAKKYAQGTIKDTYAKYPNLGKELPAVGYSKKEIKDLEATINKAKCDLVISATPTDLRRILQVNKPIVQITYEIKPITGRLDRIIKSFAKKMGP
ncbi:MAG: cyclic 2,3-diphosphoglycerate synthase [Candidatus Micrarchaeia archaeon]